MAKIGVRLKIDVGKIDKASLFTGKKGIYLDVTAFIDLDQLDQYGNSGMITQDLSQERSMAGEKGPILGNSIVFWKDYAQQAPAQQQAPQQQHAPAQPYGQSQQAPQQMPPMAQPAPNQAPPMQAPQQQNQMPNNDFDDDIPFWKAYTEYWDKCCDEGIEPVAYVYFKH